MTSLCQAIGAGNPVHFLRMTTIPSGRFGMGGRDEDKFVSDVELPCHEVEIKEAFRMSSTPVTQAQWREVMGCLPRGNSAALPDTVPVVCVCFADAQAFCRELGAGYRLPSEAEWEYACRAGSDTVFPHGGDVSIKNANYLFDELGSEIGKGSLMPVGSHGTNAFGLADMIGNVCEWVADMWHPGYSGAPEGTTAWIVDGKSGCRVIRGGGWDHLPRVLRSSWRDWAPEDACWDNLGFRVVEDLSE